MFAFRSREIHPPSARAQMFAQAQHVRNVPVFARLPPLLQRSRSLSESWVPRGVVLVLSTR
eukprot:7830111-Alexandrium_andersonii.AAC.1